MTMDAKDRELLAELANKMEHRKISWHPTAQADVFTVALAERFTFTVSENDESVFTFRLRDADGTEVLTVREQGHVVISSNGPGIADDFTVQDFFEAAKRTALKTDEKVADLMARLKKL